MYLSTPRKQLSQEYIYHILAFIVLNPWHRMAQKDAFSRSSKKHPLFDPPYSLVQLRMRK